MVKFEDVKNVTTDEYFNGNQFSIDAFNKKYTVHDKETYVQAIKRVCDYIASVEKTEELRTYWSERWFDEIFDDWWHPAGSIMQGAGSGRKISLANCTTISLGLIDEDVEWDNLESIIRNTTYTVAKTAAYRQGLGVDFSRLRPSGATILNSANESTGPVHWMKFVDSVGYYVGQKGRIPAMLFSLSIKHPNIEQFITVKSDYTKIQNANISVQITKDFYKAVEKDEDWELKFVIPGVKRGDKIYVDEHSATMICEKDKVGYYYIATHDKSKEVISKIVKAKKILELIAKNMYQNGEPGIQNIDIARKYSNSDYVFDENDEYDSRIISTNACSEQYLSRESLCVLSSINMGKFSVIPNMYQAELSKIGESILRFLDNVNECELQYKTYATAHQKLAIEKLRRVGAGVTNIGEWLFKLNLEYDSDGASENVEEFMKWYNYVLYKTSQELGKEKNNFGLFKHSKFIESPFVQRMMKMFPDLDFKTMRNVTCSSIAPTGTLSLMFRNMVFSYGVEPGTGMYSWKRTRISGKYEYYFIVPSIVRQTFEMAGFKIPMETDTVKDTWDGSIGKPIAKFIDEHRKEVGIKFTDAVDIKAIDKLKLMSRLMRWVDSSISTTYMLSEKSTWKDVYNFILEANQGEIKSLAAFPNRKMYGIISQIPFKELATNLKNEGVQIHPQNFSPEEQEQMNIYDVRITASNNAPKRPKRIDADIYNVTVKGEKFCVAIGLLNNVPYEIFCGHLNGLGFKFQYKKGYIEKVKRGQYKLEIGEDIEIEDFSKQFTPTEKTTFRLVSTSLRHGVPLNFVVEQLEKASDDMFSMTAAAGRVLKKYIKEGTTMSGMSCPVCHGMVEYGNDGCAHCTQCDWQRCN
jgi:ribonucleoside-diphosphate reductase alpha chain